MGNLKETTETVLRILLEGLDKECFNVCECEGVDCLRSYAIGPHSGGTEGPVWLLLFVNIYGSSWSFNA